MEENNSVQKLSSEIPQEKPESLVPDHVKQNRDLERKRYENQLVVDSVPEKKEETITPKKRFKKPDFLKNVPLRKIFKIIIIIFSTFIFVFGSFLVLTLTNLDLAVFKITLSGEVRDRVNNSVVEGVDIYINDELKDTTDSNGRYSIGGLNVGNVSIRLEKDKFQTLEQEIPINRLFLNYSTVRNFEITPGERATVEGVLLSPDTSYVFLDEKIFIDDEEFRPNRDGTFTLTGIYIGEREFRLESINHKDIVQTINVIPGINRLSNINLSVAGDILGDTKSFIREDIVDVEFEINNVNREQILVEDGNFVIKDLEVGREYSIRTRAEGYFTRDYSIKIEQGFNQIFNFKLVEQGINVFLAEDSETSTRQFFISDFDGENKRKVSNFPRNSNVGSYSYNVDDNKIYFQSNYERLTGVSQNTQLMYQIDLSNGNQISRLTQNTANLGTIIPSYRTKKIFNISRSGFGSSSANQISLMDFDGNNRTNIESINGEIRNIIVARSLQYAYFEARSGNTTTIQQVSLNSSDRRNIASGEDITLYDLSANDRYLLYSRGSQSSPLVSLIQVDLNSNEERTIESNIDGAQYQFLDGSNEQMLFVAQRGGNYNIFLKSIPDNSDNRITNLNQTQPITIYQQSRYLFYIASGITYIIDPLKPFSYKEVSI